MNKCEQKWSDLNCRSSQRLCAHPHTHTHTYGWREWEWEWDTLNAVHFEALLSISFSKTLGSNSNSFRKKICWKLRCRCQIFHSIQKLKEDIWRRQHFFPFSPVEFNGLHILSHWKELILSLWHQKGQRNTTLIFPPFQLEAPHTHICMRWTQMANRTFVVASRRQEKRFKQTALSSRSTSFQAQPFNWSTPL